MLRQISPSRSRFGSSLSASSSSPSQSPQRLNNMTTNHRLPSPELRRHTGERPTLPRCYLCGQQFGTRSIGIHIPQCYAKKMAQWAIADPHTRGQPPKHPDSVNWRGDGQSALQQSEEQFQEFVRNLEPCPHCGRRFIADRLQVHLRSCRPGHTARPITPTTTTSNNNNNLSKTDISSKPHTPPNRFASSSPAARPHSPSLAQVKSIISNNNNNTTNKKVSLKANTLPAISPSSNNNNNNKMNSGHESECAGYDKRVYPLTNRLPNNNSLLPDSSRTCPSCQTVEYDHAARFCKECGHHFAEAMPRPGGHHYQPSTCIHCGDALPSSARFCPTCGEPVEETSHRESHSEQPSQYNDKCQTNKLNDAGEGLCGTEATEHHKDTSAKQRPSYTTNTTNKSKSNEEEDENASAEQVSLAVRMSACPACKALCDADGNFCDHCGAALGEEELVTRNTIKVNNNGNGGNNNNNVNGVDEAYCMYCAACKEKIEDMTSIYCEECGGKLEKRLTSLVTVPQTLPPLEQSNAIKALKSALQPTTTTSTGNSNTNNKNMSREINKANNDSGRSTRTQSNSPERSVKSRLNTTPSHFSQQSEQVQEYNNNNNNNNIGNVAEEEGQCEEEERRQCPRCNRCFVLSSYARHVQVCQAQKPRRVFNMRKKRLSGLEVPGQRATSSSNSSGSYNKYSSSRIGGGGNNGYVEIRLTPPSVKKDWRAESRAFRQALREARKVDAMLKSGAPLHNLPPPTYSENANYISCPHCTRRFAPDVAARHIPRCATTINKPKPPPQHPRRR